MRRGRDYKRGRPRLRSVGGKKVRRQLCSAPSRRHSSVHARNGVGLRQDDTRLRQSHPLRRPRHHGCGRRRSRARKAAPRSDLRRGAPQSHRRVFKGQAQKGSGPPRRGNRIGGRHVQKGLRQELRARIHWSRHSQPLHGLPLRHRRHDHRNGVPHIHLGDRLRHRRIFQAARQAGSLQASPSRRPRILRRRRRHRSLPRRADDSSSLPSL